MYIRLDQPAPARKLGYVLLWLLAQRIECSEEYIIQYDLEDWDLVLRAATLDREDTFKALDYSYADLVNDCKDEINFLINGASFPTNSQESRSLAIQSPLLLELIANALGNFDGVVGFALAGNENCPDSLLKDLEASNFTYLGDSTSQRVQQLLKLR